MREVGIVGVGHSVFGKMSDGTFTDLLSMAAVEALDDAGVKTGSGHGIDQVFVATMGAGILNKQSGIASALVDYLNLKPAMAETIENGPASGASAIKLGYMAIASGMCDCVLVVGGEMMRVVSGWEGTDFVATMLHPEAEYNYGLTLPAFAGLFTKLCMDKYGITEKDLSIVAVKNHENAVNNPVAHIHVVPNLYCITEDEDANIINPY
ncbi:MAG: acetyl-CoA acetyltransferase, partial [Clostridiaceae bacterium]|nr:acetyl-CoA acetyltransferase [Clostridiaceae bacterium]